ncbi:MAG: hypothetical protein QM652_10235 [Legionella sp.]|uniref:hypothetical protein n=1 Tax=Legionella sp. TaxID=459 RepID=UPI0039E5BD60
MLNDIQLKTHCEDYTTRLYQSKDSFCPASKLIWMWEVRHIVDEESQNKSHPQDDINSVLMFEQLRQKKIRDKLMSIKSALLLLGLSFNKHLTIEEITRTAQTLRDKLKILGKISVRDKYDNPLLKKFVEAEQYLISAMNFLNFNCISRLKEIDTLLPVIKKNTSFTDRDLFIEPYRKLETLENELNEFAKNIKVEPPYIYENQVVIALGRFQPKKCCKIRNRFEN